MTEKLYPQAQVDWRLHVRFGRDDGHWDDLLVPHAVEIRDVSVVERMFIHVARHPDVLEAVDIDKLVARRTTTGGTGHEAVRGQLAKVRDAIAADAAWIEAAGESQWTD